jgi:hypothetical protein
LVHSSGGSRAWHWYQFSSNEGLMADGIKVLGMCDRDRNHIARQIGRAGERYRFSPFIIIFL